MQQTVRRLTISQYMQEFGIASRTTVYHQIKNGVVNAVDLNKGQAGRPTWRIIIDDQQLQAAA